MSHVQYLTNLDIDERLQDLDNRVENMESMLKESVTMLRLIYRAKKRK